MKRVAVCLLSLAAIVSIAPAAKAYPVAIIFLPTAKSRDPLTVGGFVYGYNVMTPWPHKLVLGSWFGIETGVMPCFKVGELELGGAEIGIDAIATSDQVKPILNAKLSIMKQYRWIPASAVGFMQFAPAHLSESLNAGYVVFTESFVVGENKTDLGSLSLGMTYSFAPDVEPGEEPIFHGTWPFKFNSRLAPLIGYVSPTWHMLNIGIESVGGYSENSAITAGLFLSPYEWLYFTIGAWSTNDFSRKYYGNGAFVMAGFEWEFLHKKEAESPSAQARLHRLPTRSFALGGAQ